MLSQLWAARPEWGDVSPGNVLPLEIFVRNALDGEYDTFLLGHGRQSAH
jgi:hypothetical protein